MIKRFTSRFSRKEDGGLSVEAVLTFPLLIWAITATFVFFDAFRSLHISQRATYTISDMLSRETEAVDRDYLTAMHELFVYLSNDEQGTSAIRVSVVERGLDPDGNEETTLQWSEAVGGEGHPDITPLADRIPEMMVGDQLIVVETEHDWAPGFAVGLVPYRFREVSVARPRFAPQLVWKPGIGNGAGGAGA